MSLRQKMKRCDVHVLTLEHEREDWLQECLDSMKCEPVTVHVLPGIINGQGQARANGFRKGDAEFVSYADPDDAIIPGAFQLCFDVLDQNPELDGVWTAQRSNPMSMPDTVIDDTHYKQPEYPRYAFDIHHLVVIRRTSLEPYLDELATWTGGCEKGLWIRMVESGRHFQFIPHIGYFMRNRRDSARSWRVWCPIVHNIVSDFFERIKPK